MIDGEGAYAFVDFSFETGPVSHQLTTGVQYSTSLWHMHPDTNTEVIEYRGLPLASPAYFDQPLYPPHGREPRHSAYDQRTRNITLGDDIALTPHWSLLLGVSHSSVIYRNYDDGGLRTDSYDESELTPTLSLVFKPMASLTTYLSYIEGLEQGGMAADIHAGLPVVNAGKVMSPLVSRQVEIGAKQTVGGLLLSAALFEIDKPLEYYEILDGTRARLVQDGRQVHRGLEFTATGTLTRNLTIVGGFTLLDARIRRNEAQPELEGKRPRAVAERLFKVYGEYAVPAVPGLVLNAGLSHNGHFYGDNLNTDRLPSYTLLDIGARYVIDAGGQPLTLRLAVNNLADKRYWANEFFLGRARHLIASATIRF